MPVTSQLGTPVISDNPDPLRGFLPSGTLGAAGNPVIVSLKDDVLGPMADTLAIDSCSNASCSSVSQSHAVTFTTTNLVTSRPGIATLATGQPMATYYDGGVAGPTLKGLRCSASTSACSSPAAIAFTRVGPTATSADASPGAPAMLGSDGLFRVVISGQQGSGFATSTVACELAVCGTPVESPVVGAGGPTPARLDVALGVDGNPFIAIITGDQKLVAIGCASPSCQAFQQR